MNYDSEETKNMPTDNEVQNYLNLLKRICESKDGGARKRQVVHDYCKRHSVDKKIIWRHIALYKEGGSAWVSRLLRMQSRRFFRIQEEKLEGKIVDMIGQLPYEALPIFRDLLNLTDDFLERVRVIGEVVISCFLEGEKGLILRSFDTTQYTNLFIQMISEELETLKEISKINTMAIITSSYKQWLGAIAVSGQDIKNIKEWGKNYVA